MTRVFLSMDDQGVLCTDPSFRRKSESRWVAAALLKRTCMSECASVHPLDIKREGYAQHPNEEVMILPTLSIFCPF